MITTKRKLEELKAKQFEEFPTVKNVLTWLQASAGTGTRTTCCYQGTDLIHHSEAMSYFRRVQGLAHCYR